jgi:hypothetical protein
VAGVVSGLAGPGSGLSEVPVWGCEPATLEGSVALFDVETCVAGWWSGLAVRWLLLVQ